MQKPDPLIRTKLRLPLTLFLAGPPAAAPGADRSRAARSAYPDYCPRRFWQNHPGGILYGWLWVARCLAFSRQE